MATNTKQPYQRLEDDWAKYVGTRFAVGVNNGTNALTLALGALGVGEGDEVIIPEYTMVACAWAVTYLGATPIFVDCGPDLNIDPSRIEDAITENTKAIMPVHIYGRVCNMDAIKEIALRYNIYVVEDCAEAHGAEWKGHKVGSIGDIGCFSLYRNKIINSEEGGLCTTSDPVLYERMQHLKNMCFDENQSYLHDRIGWNMRITNMQASMAIDQIKKIDKFIKHRKAIAKTYDKYLEQYTMGRREGDVYWAYDIHVRNRDTIYQAIKKRYPSLVRYGFKPMSLQPMYYNPFKTSLPDRALDVANHCFYLYLPNDMTKEQAEEVARFTRAEIDNNSG